MFLDLESTKTVTVAGKDWTVSAVPAGIVAELTARVGAVVSPVPQGLLVDGQPAPGREQEWADLAARRFGQYLAIHAEWIRWGLRTYRGAGEERTFSGRTFRLLDADRVEALLRVNAGALAHDLGRAIHAANIVSEEEALGFLSPSGAART